MNAGCEAILLYLTTTQELKKHFKLKGHRVSVHTVDLSQEWPQIKAALLQIIQE